MTYRDALRCELDENYFNIAKKRIKKVGEWVESAV